MSVPQAPIEKFSLKQAVLDAGGRSNSAEAGQTAFHWKGRPRAFVFLTDGKLNVQFRTAGRQVPWAECRATSGQDCMPVTAAILSDRDISVRASCTVPCTWIELSPTSLILLVHGDMKFRRALFGTHAARLPTFFARLSSKNVMTLECRLANWLLAHATSGEVRATHGEIARDLLTAREVISRKLQVFAKRNWVLQKRGLVQLTAPVALRHLANGLSSVCPSDLDAEKTSLKYKCLDG